MASREVHRGGDRGAENDQQHDPADDPSSGPSRDGEKQWIRGNDEMMHHSRVPSSKENGGEREGADEPGDDHEQRSRR
jgi:hypothetical protein